MVLEPGRPYIAVFDATDRRTVKEIGLTLEGQSDALKALVGQKVFVWGVIQLEPNSPYYWNGTLIAAKTIRIANGKTLTPKQEKPVGVPDSVTRFHSLVTFAPRASQRWDYQTWDDQGHLLSGSPDYLTCALNGPGDVMNCYCPAGFSFTATGTISTGKFKRAAGPQDGLGFAQFSISDPVSRAIAEAVECTRDNHH